MRSDIPDQNFGESRTKILANLANHQTKNLVTTNCQKLCPATLTTTYSNTQPLNAQTSARDYADIVQNTKRHAVTTTVTGSLVQNLVVGIVEKDEPLYIWPLPLADIPKLLATKIISNTGAATWKLQCHTALLLRTRTRECLCRPLRAKEECLGFYGICLMCWQLVVDVGVIKL